MKILNSIGFKSAGLKPVSEKGPGSDDSQASHKAVQGRSLLREYLANKEASLCIKSHQKNKADNRVNVSRLKFPSRSNSITHEPEDLMTDKSSLRRRRGKSGLLELSSGEIYEHRQVDLLQQLSNEERVKLKLQFKQSQVLHVNEPIINIMDGQEPREEQKIRQFDSNAAMDILEDDQLIEEEENQLLEQREDSSVSQQDDDAQAAQQIEPEIIEEEVKEQ